MDFVTGRLNDKLRGAGNMTMRGALKAENDADDVVDKWGESVTKYFKCS